MSTEPATLSPSDVTVSALDPIVHHLKSSGLFGIALMAAHALVSDEDPSEDLLSALGELVCTDARLELRTDAAGTVIALATIADDPAPARDEAPAAADPAPDGAAPVAPFPATAPTEISPEEVLRMENERLKARLARMERRFDAITELALDADQTEAEWESAKAETKKLKDELDEKRAAVQKAVLDKDTGAEDEAGSFGEQMTLDQAIAEGAPAPAAAPTVSPEEELRARAAAGDVLTIEGLDWANVHTHALSQVGSLGKPPKVKLLEIPLFEGRFVCTDILADGEQRTARFDQVYDAEAWTATYGETVKPLDLPNSERTGLHDAGGPLFGCPVKVGRKVHWIGKTEHALLVRMPKEAAVSAASVMPAEGEQGAQDDADQDESAQ